MSRTFPALPLSLIAGLLLGGCAFVETTSKGETVRVAATDEISDCQRLGQTRVTVLDHVAGIPRPPATMEKELTTLARNSAGKMGGDTVVAMGEMIKGEQTFRIYSCGN